MCCCPGPAGWRKGPRTLVSPWEHVSSSGCPHTRLEVCALWHEAKGTLVIGAFHVRVQYRLYQHIATLQLCGCGRLLNLSRALISLRICNRDVSVCI